MTRPCYRHLDRRFEVFMGLSHLDLIGSVFFALLVMATVHPLAGIVAGILLALLLKYLKEGKPRGYLWHLAYRLGLLSLLPDGIRPRGLVPPPSLFGPPERRYSSVSGEADDDGWQARHFWSGRIPRSR